MPDPFAREMYHIIEKTDSTNELLPYIFTLFIDVSDLRHNICFYKEKLQY